MIGFCDGIAFHPPYLEHEYKNAISIVEKATGKSYEEILELLK